MSTEAKKDQLKKKNDEQSKRERKKQREERKNKKNSGDVNVKNNKNNNDIVMGEGVDVQGLGNRDTKVNRKRKYDDNNNNHVNLDHEGDHDMRGSNNNEHSNQDEPPKKRRKVDSAQVCFFLYNFSPFHVFMFSFLKGL